MEEKAKEPIKSRRGRPPLPPGETRVKLDPQRVTGETLVTLQEWAKTEGGIGKAIDMAVTLARKRINQGSKRPPVPASKN